MTTLRAIESNIAERRGRMLDRRMYPSPAEAPKRAEIERVGEGRNALSVFAIPFDTATVLWEDRWGQIREVIPSRVRVSYYRDDLFALHNHNWDRVLGRLSSETMEVLRDADGYKAVVHLADTYSANDLAASVERGDISGASFAFTPVEMTWHEDNKEDTLTGYVEEMVLYEFTVTPIPQYETTDVTLVKRSLEEWRAEQDQMRREVRERLAARLSTALPIPHRRMLYES